MAIIIILIDGVGLAPHSEANLVATNMPQLTRVLEQPLTDALSITRAGLLATPIDATLGMPGLPQSGTGHTAIWGGFNAAQFNGRHQPSYPTIAMRERLQERSMFSAVQAMGRQVAWANAYLPGYMEAVKRHRIRHTAGTWAALQAGLRLRGVSELLDGSALSWDITQQLAQARVAELPLISPSKAAQRLHRLAHTYDLVAFETYLPDLAAHSRLDISLDEALKIVDQFATGLLEGRATHDTVVLTSDHGNSEDATTTHTRNAVPLIVAGPAAARFEQVHSIDQIMAAVLASLSADQV